MANNVFVRNLWEKLDELLADILFLVECHSWLDFCSEVLTSLPESALS